MRTRMPPNWRVRQWATPFSPRCSVRSIDAHSVVPKAIPLISMGRAPPICARSLRSLSVLAFEPLAVPRELPLQLLAARPRHGHAPRLVLVEGQGRVHAGDIVPPKRVGELLGAERVETQPLQRRATGAQRRLEGLALRDPHAAQPQLEVMAHVARPAHDLE